MAILFFEGLPGAGKSYEAMSTQIIPALQKGREVVAYLEGLDGEECQARIAEASGLPLEQVQALLFPLTREDMRPREAKGSDGKIRPIDGLWIEKVRDNALIVLDEAQNWWPNRLRATEALTQFVTEHRHRGIDVLLMGQSLLDVLALWRRRVDQKFTFLKLTALGSDKRYRVTVFKGQGNDEFVKVTDKLGKYDPKYFGTYKSHVSAETNTATYTDNRANFLKSGMVRYGIPLCIVLLAWGGWKSWAFFHPDAPKPGSASAATMKPSIPASERAPAKSEAKVPEVDLRSPEERYFSDMAGKARARLAGYIEGAGKRFATVEWLDGGTRIIERLSLEQLEALGVKVVLRNGTAKLSMGGWTQVATMWPLEVEGKVSEARQEKIRNGPPVADYGPQQEAGIAPGLIVIADAGRASSAPSPASAPSESQPSRVGSFKR